jgi:hypothetical protein
MAGFRCIPPVASFSPKTMLLVQRSLPVDRLPLI